VALVLNEADAGMTMEIQLKERLRFETLPLKKEFCGGEGTHFSDQYSGAGADVSLPAFQTIKNIVI